jgi:hypothetical protein
MMRRPAAGLAALALAAWLMPALPRLAHADARQQQSFNAWRQMQDCARAANKQFPDHTPEGNAKREAARQECLRLHHLPVTPEPTR